jgi:hypothetical protein
VEIVLIAVLIALCWAVWRRSTATDRPRKLYAARHVLGPLPEEISMRRHKVIRRKRAQPAITPREHLADTENFEDEFDDDWLFPPFGRWMHPWRLPYIDYVEPDDIAPSRLLLSTMYFDDINEPFESHHDDDDDFQAHYDYYDDP